MATNDRTNNRIRTPARELGLHRVSKDEITDLHPHTTYSDGTQSVVESLEEAVENNVWEKGTIEHGNPIDEDIGYIPKFLSWEAVEKELGFIDERKDNYTSPDIFPIKYENLREVVNDIDEAIMLNYADPDEIKEDVETLNRIESTGETTWEDILNYTLVVPHGIEIDYNPAIEFSDREYEGVESYEDSIVEFLKDAESANCGINYILASSHHVNTPLQPKYVKKDELFDEMSLEEKEEVLEYYRKKEIYKILSLAERLREMNVPEVSGELMDPEKSQELKEFIYGQSSATNDIPQNVSNRDIAELTGRDLEVEKPGVIVIGSHPTLIERNQELLDVFRDRQGLATLSEIEEDLNEFIYDTAVEEAEGVGLHNIVDEEVDREQLIEDMSDEGIRAIYPDEELREYYRPVVEASEDSDNFLFEINGKGVERQVPSVFWSMVDQNTFGSDAHRPDEQPSRSKKYSDMSVGDTVLFSEKWVEMLEDSK